MTRQAFADALDTVTGVAGHLVQPSAPVPGQGWPQWVQTRYVSTSCGPRPDGSEWEVLVVLPVLNPTAGDALRDTIAEALGAVGTVELAEPGTLELAADWTQPAPIIRYTVEVNEGTA